MYSELNQAFKLSQIDNDDFSGWECSSTANAKEYVSKYWLPYFKGAKLCETFQECGYSIKRPWKSNDRVNVSAEDVTGTKARYGIMLMSGAVISFRVAPTANFYQNEQSNAPKINVDINGAKGPNVSGVDYFWFIPTNNGVIPYGLGWDSEVIDRNCSKDIVSGVTCSSKLVKDNFEIKSDYPF